jgi:hypothetical protein
MLNRSFGLRLAFVPAYALVAWGLLYCYYAGDSLCGYAGAPSVRLATMRFALLATALDTIVSLVAGLFRREKRTPSRLKWRSLLEALAVGLILYCAQNFLFDAVVDSQRLDGTLADVSCLLTEGYGMLYPFVVVPAVALLTFVRENLFDWVSRKVPD